MREIAAGRSVEVDAPSSGNGLRQLDQLKAAILILSLYNDSFFDVPAAVVIDSGWRIDWLKRARERTGPEYKITEEEWPKFELFVRAAERAIRFIPGLDSYPRFSIAAERYLRATFATGHSFFSELHSDEYTRAYTFDEVTGEEVISRGTFHDERSLQEDVLLNYVFALETLVGKQTRGGSGTKESKVSTNPAARVASLIGRDWREEEFIQGILTSAYDDRSDIVHEGHLQREPADLRVLRRCCQRTLGMVITLSATAKRFAEVKKVICGDSDPDKRERVDHAREELFSLLADGSRLDQWKGPRRDQFER